MAENLNSEEIKLRNNLKKMIRSFDSYIKEADDYEQLEDNLKHMEETDENFHKLICFYLFQSIYIYLIKKIIKI
jgi:hypothetical protein